MASALPVMSRVCEPIFPSGPPRNRSPTKAITGNHLDAVVGMVLACFEGTGLIRFRDRRGKYRHEDDDVSSLAGGSEGVVAQRRQGRGRSVEIAAAQTEKKTPQRKPLTQAVRLAKPQVRPVASI